MGHGTRDTFYIKGEADMFQDAEVSDASDHGDEFFAVCRAVFEDRIGFGGITKFASRSDNLLRVGGVLYQSYGCCHLVSQCINSCFFGELSD